MALNIQTILFKILGDNTSGIKALDQINKKLLGVGTAMTAVSDAALLMFAKLGESGAKLDAIEGKFRRMMTSMGLNADEMLAKWDRATQGSITSADLMAKANYMALTGIPLDEMEWMLAAAKNAAEATGISLEILFEKLSYGLARQSKPLLDDLGIVFNAQEAYKQYAATIGKAASELTSQEKLLAFATRARQAATRQEEILGKATENSAARITRARVAVKNMGNEISKAFIPVAEVAAKVILFLAGVFNKIPKPILQAIAVFLSLAAAFGAIVGPVATVVALWPVIGIALNAIGAAAASLLPIVALVGVIAAGVAVMARAWKENWGGIQDTVMFVVDTIRPYIQTIIYQVQYWMTRIKMQIEGIVLAIRALVEPALIRLRALLGDGAGLKEFMVTMRDAVGAMLSFVEAILNAIRLVLEGKADKAWDPLKDAALNVITVIVITWRKYISKALIWGWNLVVNLANGIVRAAKSVLQAAASYVGSILSGFWEAHSPPKKGPLAGIVQWGKSLMETYLRAFQLADFGILNDVMDPVQQALQAAVGLGDMDEKTSLVIFRDVRRQVAELIAEFRKTGQISDEIMSGIAARLGEGGQDYVEYLRLTLEHQKALQRLKVIEDEVAAAEKKGFVPAALKARLKAAQDEADAKQEAVDWQREYLAALQEGVDIQVQMLQAMKDLTEAIKAGKGGGVDIEKPDDIPDPTDTKEDIKREFGGFGGFSQEFENMKKMVEDWFTALPGKVNVWLDQVRLYLAQKGLEIIDSTRITLLTLWAIIVFRFAQIMAIVAFYLSKWLIDARQTIQLIGGILVGGFYLFIIRLKEFLLDIYERLRVTFLQIRGIVAGTLLLLYLKVDEWLTLINTWIVAKITEAKDAVVLFATEFFTAGENIIQGLWDGIKARWELLKVWFQTAIQDLPQWMKDLLGIHSGSRVFRYLGRMTVKGFEEGISGFSQLQGTLRGAMANMLPGSLQGMGQQVFVVQVPGLTLPGIRDGRDAKSLIDQVLQQSVDAARLRGIVPGGVMY